jgi:phosphoglycolate phosphatase
MGQIKLLIFDLDGTLVDSAPDIISAVNGLLLERDEPPLREETITAAIGEGPKKLVFSLFPETQDDPFKLRELEKDFYRFYDQELLKKSRLFPGVEDFLDENTIDIALVTNKPERFTRRTVEGLGLTRYKWTSIFSAESLPQRKPDPLPLLEAATRAGHRPDQCLMIGDGRPDMIAARRAGIHSIAVEFGYMKLEILKSLGAALTLPSFADLPRIIRLAEKLSPRPPSLE